MTEKNKNNSGNNKIKTKEFYVVWSMTYIHMIKSKGLHHTLIFLDKFTIQMIAINVSLLVTFR
jgi:hypothetical protein